MMKRIKTKLWKDSKSKKFADPQQNDRPNKFGSNRKKDKPPCGAPRGVSRVEADGRRSGPCPDPWRRHQPFCPPAPSDQATPRAPAPRSPEGNKISLEKECFLLIQII